MRKLTILVLGLAMGACNNSSQPTTQHQATASADSVLYSDIIRPITDSLQQFPQNHALYYRRALLLFNTHPDMAQKDFEQAAKLDSANTDYWAGAGEAALVAGNHQTAAHLFSRALQTAPNYPYLQYKLATAMVENKQYTSADSLADLLAKSGEGADQAFYLKARIAEDHKDTVSTVRYLTQAIAVAGDHPEYDALMELADLLSVQKQKDAVQYYVQAWKLDSTNAEPLYFAGRFQERMAQQEAAIASYRKSIISDPNFEASYMALGDIYRNHKNWKEAYTFYNLAAKAAPTDALAYYQRALCQENLGKKEMALEDYIKASSFKKDFTEAKAAIKRLSK
ncbi:MAG: tetratricopeptide repeat protein [Chitinophaga sp.]|uniref:tetratricopeptide repeat protein n=1 Tax=Chitinophaga sp. TaxID=1869181 RepID=UPI0025C5E592|nr:tetratricopeptide repeat protein [Chitinophaga sp.]MBV8251697.1 tetratricopeptide repeat protein [Chitinophaga sp.]